MNDRKQAELLEQYLITLRHDPGATPPDDLDPIIAELARKFKQQATFRPNHDARARIWQRTLANTRRDAQFSSLAPENIWQITQITEAKTEPRRVVYPVTLSAAVMAVMLFFAAMLIFASRPPEDLDDPATTTPNQYASTGNITPTEEVETTTTALASPTDPKVTDSMPALVDRMTWINQLPSFGVRVSVPAPIIASVGTILDGSLTMTQPVITYQFTIPQSGVVIARVESQDFTPGLFYTVELGTLRRGVVKAQLQLGTGGADAPSGEPGISSVIMEGNVQRDGPHLAVPGQFSGAGQEQIMFVAQNPNPIWFPASAGDVIELHVISLDAPPAFGSFHLKTRWLSPTTLTTDRVETFAFNPTDPFGYFIFNGRGGDRLHLNINGEKQFGRQAFFFRADHPLPFNPLQKVPDFGISGTGDGMYPLAPDNDGIFGIVIGPEDIQTTGSFDVLLKPDGEQP